MEIYFDRKTLKILKKIKRSGNKGITWGKLQERFGNDVANIFLLETLSRELYTVTQDSTGAWVDFVKYPTRNLNSNYRSFCSPKGNELLERRSFDFWKWIIPTIISIAALIVSFLAIR